MSKKRKGHRKHSLKGRKRKAAKKGRVHSHSIHLKSPKGYIEKEISDSSLHKKADRLSLAKKSRSVKAKKANKEQSKHKKMDHRPRRRKKKVLDSVFFETGLALGKVGRLLKKKR
jgi:hypothetical protein